MNEFEEYLEKLQNLDHDTKIKVMWIGVSIAMIVIIFIWFSFTDFSFKKNTGVEPSDSFSKLEILKKGFSETLKDAGNLLKDFKEKIDQTNTFEIKAPEQNEQVGMTGTTTPAIQANEILENAATTTTKIIQ